MGRKVDLELGYQIFHEHGTTIKSDNCIPPLFHVGDNTNNIFPKLF